MIIYTVVEIDYHTREVHEWTFTSKDKAENLAKEKQNKYSASDYRYNSVNVFHSFLNDF